MTIAIPNNTSTQVLEANTSVIDSHAVWFQNFNTTSGINLIVNGIASATEFYLPPAGSATSPASLIVQSTGGDMTLVNRGWSAFQASGGELNLNCGRW